MKEEELYKSALLVWGPASQFLQTVQECAELNLAICHAFNDRHAFVSEQVAEEIADVEIMLGQLKAHAGMGPLVEVFKGRKLRRLEDMLVKAGVFDTRKTGGNGDNSE